jgi:hypothetical protein
MERIQISTTIDITDTGVKRPGYGTEKEFNQYKNYMTFHQVLGLRSNFIVIDPPKFEKERWTMIVETDRDAVYSTSEDPVGLLKEDLHQVPILTGLDEVKQQKHAIITTKGSHPNTFVSIVK